MIDEETFSGCLALKEIDFGNGVTTIGNNAFINCAALTAITIDKVKELGNGAFSGCVSLESVTMGDGITTIGDSAFCGCKALKNANFPQNLNYIGEKAFEECPLSKESKAAFKVAKDKIKEIRAREKEEAKRKKAEAALKKKQAAEQKAQKAIGKVIDYLDYKDEGSTITITGVLEGFKGGELVLPAQINGKPITKIANEAFSGNSSLTKVELSESIKSVGDMAFARCSSLGYVKIPDGVETLGYCAFESCECLKWVSLPASLKELSGGTFANCGSLEKLSIVKSNPYFFDDGKGAIYSKDGKTLVTCAPSVSTDTFSIPDGTLSIAEDGFRATNYKTITIPPSVKTIGENAFMECYNLKEISISEGTEEIKAGTFWDCSNLKKVTLPPTVKSIGENAFLECMNLTDINIEKTIKITAGAFEGCEKLSEEAKAAITATGYKGGF